MNSEKPIRDQAERLRKRVERKQPVSDDMNGSLPPRSDIHRQKQKKTNVKVKYPVIRLMALFFVLLPVIFFSIVSYLEGKNGTLDHVDRAGIEQIDVENSNREKINVEEETEVTAFEEADAIDSPELEMVPAPSSTNGGEKESAVPASPSEDTNKAAETAAAPAQPQEQEFIMHTVQPKETMYRVSLKYYGSNSGIEKIKKANNLQGIDIKAGQILKIPK